MSGIKLATRIDSLEESATLALNARVKQMAASGESVYNLTAGELACDTPEHIQAAAAESLHLNKYTPVAGLPELRQMIASHTAEFYDADWIKPPNVVVTAGAKPALYAALMSLLNPGDEVIVPVPAWVSYLHLIELAGGKMVKVAQTSDYDLYAQTIKNAITSKTKAIIVNSPQNPTGAVFSSDSLRKLSELLEDTEITVIADDIYTKLVFSGSGYQPITNFGFKNLVIINGFSKSQALTGWRIGYLIADEQIAVAATKILSHIMGNASVPAQMAGLAALKHGDKPVMLDVLEKQRDLVDRKLSEISSLQHNRPDGAFYVFIDLRIITNNSLEWCAQLLADTGVALVPGEAFLSPGFARLSFVTDESTLTKALDLIAKFVKQERHGV